MFSLYCKSIMSFSQRLQFSGEIIMSFHCGDGARPRPTLDLVLVVNQLELYTP